MHGLWLGKEAFGSVCQMLETRLEEDGESQLVGMGGNVWMLRVGEGAWGIVHRSYDIACERESGIVGGCLLGEGRHIVVPLCSVDTLGREEVGIGALPSSWDGRSVEVDEEMVASGSFEEVDAVAHVHLVVAREEVNLHSCHTEALAPGELLLAVFRFIESELWSWSAIDPSHGGVVPYHGSYALVFGIAYGIFHSLAVLELVPLGVDEDIGEAESYGEVDRTGSRAIPCP